MTNQEFTEAYGELCDAANWFADQLAGEPTLEARNVMFHRERFLDCLEEWHRSHLVVQPPRNPTMKPIPPDALRRLVQVCSEISCGLSPTPSGQALAAALESMLEAVDAYRAECRASGDQ